MSLDVEAEVTALACSKPPAGAKRWTLVLREQEARGSPGMQNIRREEIRRLLKKLPQTLVGRPYALASRQATCFSIVSPPETSNLPGASTLSVFTTPSSTSIE